MSQFNLKKMTRAELRSYILKHRNDDEKVRAAIEESAIRPGWTDIPSDAPLEEVKQIIANHES